MRAKKKTGRKRSAIVLLGIIGALLVAFSLATFMSFEMGIDDYTSVIDNVLLGIDLKGGAYVVLEAERPEDVNDTDFAASFQGTKTVLQQRLTAKGYTEATIVEQGGNRFRIEIPDVKDETAVFEVLGQTAVLEFQKPSDGAGTGEVVISGANVTSAFTTYDENNQPAVAVQLDSDGQAKFSAATAELVGSTIEIYLDGTLLSSPSVSQQITGNPIITGMGTLDNAKNLAIQLQSGALPLELVELEQRVVSATLGQDALSLSLIAGVIGIFLIILFMSLYYRGLGISASVTLIIYLLVLIWLIAGAPLFFTFASVIPKTQLTLPGLAGVILSIGMAVDGNIVIFERIRDEYRLGKSIEASIKVGFKRATGAIIDSNVTTIIAAVALMFGAGSIRGFAQVLLVGIILSVVCSLVVTRLLLKLFLRINRTSQKFYGLKREEERRVPKIFARNLRVVENKKKYFTGSLVVIGIGILVMSIFGMNLGIDFTGGTILNVTVGADMDDNAFDGIVAAMNDGFNEFSASESGVSVDTNTAQLMGSASDKGITIRYNLKGGFTTDEELELNNRLRTVLEAKIKAKMAELGISETYYMYKPETVGAAMSGELILQAFLLVAIAAVGMLIYLLFRFKFLMGLASVIALVHDVLIMATFVAVFRMQINSTFVAAMITIVGYSINASIVLFDRVRENAARLSLKDAPNGEIVNKSIKETMTRSLYSTGTTMVTILVLAIIGVPAVQEFAVPIIVGLIAGTYSSVLLVGPMWVVFQKWADKWRAGRAEKKALADREKGKEAPAGKKLKQA